MEDQVVKRQRVSWFLSTMSNTVVKHRCNRNLPSRTRGVENDVKMLRCCRVCAE